MTLNTCTKLITHHGAEWNSSGGMIVDCNEVDKESGATNHRWDQECTNKHLLYPSPPCSGTGTWNDHTAEQTLSDNKNGKITKTLQGCFCIKVNYMALCADIAY